MKIVTRIIEGSAKMIWIPWAAKNASNQPAAPEEQDRHQPDDDRRDREREVDERRHEALPGNRSRASTSATTTPEDVVTTTVIEHDHERQVEGVETSGWLKVSPIAPMPLEQAVVDDPGERGDEQDKT